MIEQSELIIRKWKYHQLLLLMMRDEFNQLYYDGCDKENVLLPKKELPVVLDAYLYLKKKRT